MPSQAPRTAEIRQFNPGVAQFLWYIQRADTDGLSRRVLDCAGGGANPPLALFWLQGFEPHGIDISPEQVELARAFAVARGMGLHIDVGDMRDIPFDDETFGFVYEGHSMCHLPRNGIETAVGEMVRVLEHGGYLYAEFMLESTWPRERPPEEADDPSSAQAAHSTFPSDEVVRLLERRGLTVVWSQERATRYPAAMQRLSMDEWLTWRREAHPEEDEATWRSVYSTRREAHVTAEIAVICRKHAAVGTASQSTGGDSG